MAVRTAALAFLLAACSGSGSSSYCPPIAPIDCGATVPGMCCPREAPFCCPANGSCTTSAAACVTCRWRHCTNTAGCCEGFVCERATSTCQIATKLPLGETCTAPQQCASKICVGFCTETCTAATNCGAENYCLGTDLFGFLCAPACSGNGDCAVFGGGRACPHRSGAILLQPRWRRDYQRLVADAVRRLPPSISVVLLAQDDAALLGQAIASVRAQTFPHWEMLVVKGSLGAAAQAVIEQALVEDGRIRTAGPPQADLLAARAQGLEAARGDYVYCLDSRYRSLPDALGRLHENLGAAPEAAVAYGATDAPASALAVLSRLGGGDFFNSGAVAFRRDALCDDESPEVPALEDAALWGCLLAAGSVAFVGGDPLSARGPAVLVGSAAAHARSAPEPAAKTVLVAGMGRSGTTWVADLINHDRSFRVLFEPFLPARVRETSVFEYIQYMPPEERDRVLVDAAQAILEGRVHNGWVDQESGDGPATRRLIKDIRCNLMLRWLRALRPSMPIVLVVRHPLAVAESWLKIGWGKEVGGERSIYEILTSQESLLADFPVITRLMEVIDPGSLFEQIIFQWCVSHLVPRAQFAAGELFVLVYEDLVLRPREESARLSDHLGIAMPWESVAPVVQRPSMVTRLARDMTKDRSEVVSG